MTSRRCQRVHYSATVGGLTGSSRRNPRRGRPQETNTSMCWTRLVWRFRLSHSTVPNSPASRLVAANTFLSFGGSRTWSRQRAPNGITHGFCQKVSRGKSGRPRSTHSWWCRVSGQSPRLQTVQPMANLHETQRVLD